MFRPNLCLLVISMWLASAASADVARAGCLQMAGSSSCLGEELIAASAPELARITALEGSLVSCGNSLSISTVCDGRGSSASVLFGFRVPPTLEMAELTLLLPGSPPGVIVEAGLVRAGSREVEPIFFYAQAQPEEGTLMLAEGLPVADPKALQDGWVEILISLRRTSCVEGRDALALPDVTLGPM